MFLNAEVPNFTLNKGYTGTLINNSTKIEKNDLLPGDLCFQVDSQVPGGSNHVGIFKELDANGDIIAFECRSSSPQLYCGKRRDKLFDKRKFFIDQIHFYREDNI